METKISRIGKKSISFVLSIMMILSMATVGIIAANAAISYWYIAGTFDSEGGAWTTNKYKINSGTGGYVDIDLSSFAGKEISFKAVANENGDNWCGLSSGNTITTDSKKELAWSNGDPIKYTVPSDAGKIRFTISVSDGKNYITLSKVETPAPTDPTPTQATTAQPTTQNPTVPTPAGYVTVYLQNDANWSTPYTYVWDSAKQNVKAWPGEAMTSLGNGVYSYTFSSSFDAGVIFNNGDGTKTADLTVEAGKIYNNATNQWSDYDKPTPQPTEAPTQKPTDAKPTVPTPAGSVTVYLQNDANWSTPYTYVWDSAKQNVKAWPGEAMTSLGNGVYSYTFDSKFDAGVIFNNNGGSKTDDLKVEAGKIYNNKTGQWSDYDDPTPDPVEGFDISVKATNGKVSAPAKAEAGSTVSLSFTPNPGYEFSSVKVVAADKTEITVTDNKFVMPEQKVTVTATFEFNQSKFLNNTNAIWLDATPAGAAPSPATLIKYSNAEGSNGTRANYYFYVPSSLNLSELKLYNGYSSSVSINGVTINGNSSATVSVNKNTEYAVTGATSKTVKFTQGSTASMYLYTTDKNGNAYNLPMTTQGGVSDAAGAAAYKNTVKSSGGECVTVDAAGKTATIALDTVKGRGNSSWEASTRLFGKYAYNMKLGSKTKLFGMDSAKSWCLLANNADESMFRNSVAYGLAASVGLPDAPEFTFVDIYDNGLYMGSYLVTEKVDVGSSKLVKGTSIEDINDDAGVVLGDTAKATYKNCSFQYSTVVEGSVTADQFKKGTFLLEFEITERYHDEASYFTTPQGQHITLKSPEFATKEEMEYIIDKYLEMEAVAYANNSDTYLQTLSKYIDLDSFARMYLIQELSKNLDAASTSYYITYDCTKGYFIASPIWDYDWAFGQYGNANAKKDVNGNGLNPYTTDGWFAKYKAIDDSANGGNYSLQSKLASNSNFQKVIKKVWKGTGSDGFYEIAKTYVGSNGSLGGKLKSFYDEAKESVAMNETRWHFIANDPIVSWGSKNTASNHYDAVMYLNNFISNRLGWLNSEISNYGDYTQVYAPTLKAYAEDGKTALSGAVNVGDKFVLQATSMESYVTYKLYANGTQIDSNSTGKFTISAADEGKVSYTVKTAYNGTSGTASAPVEVETVSGTHNVTFYFKGIDTENETVLRVNGNATAMTKASTLGTDKNDVTYCWYKAEVELDAKEEATVSVETNGYAMFATMTDTFANDTYYVASDDLLYGSTLVDVTAQPEYIRNYYHSAQHMVAPVYEDNTFGFTNIGGKTYELGTIINSEATTFDVKSVTAIQYHIVELKSVSATQQAVFDVNLDGEVNIDDATLIQYAIAG